MFCSAKHVFAFRSETPFFIIDGSRATREGVSRALPAPAAFLKKAGENFTLWR